MKPNFWQLSITPILKIQEFLFGMLIFSRYLETIFCLNRHAASLEKLQSQS